MVEPPGGHFTRTLGPFVDDEPGVDRSLWWWYYNTSKTQRGRSTWRQTAPRRSARLVAAADIVLEGEQPGRLSALGLDHTELRAERPGADLDVGDQPWPDQ